MSFWNGSEWATEAGATPRAKPDRAKWPATILMVLGLLAMLLPMQLVSAAKAAPELSTSCGSACREGSGVTVSGEHFIPSAGGQQVMLWVEYPNDDGVYYYPWVSADGTFSKSFDVPGSGEGGVKAFQWNAKRGKWLAVDYVGYSMR